MKTKGIVLIAIVVLLVASSSRCVNINEGITGSKNIITRDFKVGGFDKIDVSTVANVYFTQSTDGTTSLQLNGPDNIVELVNVDVKDNTLILNMKKKNINKSNLNIYISSPDISSINAHGVGNFHVEDKLEVSNLTINYDGVGDIKIKNVICTTIKVYKNGVGNAQLAGKAENVDLISQGVGNINAENLEGRFVKAESQGVGNVSCFATESIRATVNGVGNVSYKGNPKDKQVSKNGVGSIKQK